MSVLLLLLACRPDPGAPDYPDLDPLVDTADDEFLPGPDPYEPGEYRLEIGLFYEGGSSEEIPIDDTTSHYYIYSNTYGTYVSEERVEGYVSDVLVHNGGAWWGGGVTWDTPQDLTKWDTMHVSLKSDSFSGFDIALTGGGAETRVAVSGYGYAADGQWHHLAIPMTAFSASDRSEVTGPFVLVGEGGSGGDELFVDNLYYTEDR